MFKSLTDRLNPAGFKAKMEQISRFMRQREYALTYNLKAYDAILEQIEQYRLAQADETQIKEIRKRLEFRAASGSSLDLLLPEAFALAREASRRALGLFPFTEQLIAGIVLHEGKIAEMQTGEGKTLSAVMPAYLNALAGKGVHILTFSDYLAARDASWMGPVYEFLGLSVGCVREGMALAERQKAYSADITYVSAKEAGFDYLRDCLRLEQQELVQRPFHYAIIDEADSILIDEARIPLVIAGEMSGGRENLSHLAGLVKELRPFLDFELNQNGNHVFLTDSGLQHVEKMLNKSNLYQAQDLQLLARINCALHAEVLLKRDTDYILRNDRIELIDPYTGRIADKRHWPEDIQAAVEAKEGINSGKNGMILGSVTLQHFLSLYPKISGMTGTAVTSAGEFNEFYGMEVVVIPTHSPCIRIDHPDWIFTSQEAKQKALLEEINRVHLRGRPILVGTGSVAESEFLAADLRQAGIACRVLNAKNDEMEAGVIAQAGEPGAVTVSTNMAGRGIDIKLGGAREEQKEKVMAAEGLYVIGTSLFESRRVNNQLRGRAGRQGEPGESRFFISLEDELVKNYQLAHFIPKDHCPQDQEGPVSDPVVRLEITRGIRMIEGYHEDIRRQLWEYSSMIEHQRRIVVEKRFRILRDETVLNHLQLQATERYLSLSEKYGTKLMQKIEKRLTLHYLDKCWAEYLAYISDVRESIYLVALGKKNPLTEFNRIAMEGFRELSDRIETEIVSAFHTVQIDQNGIVHEKEVLQTPSVTWTYLLNENGNNFLWFWRHNSARNHKDYSNEC